MAGDELPEPVAEKTAPHEATDLQAIKGSISSENIKEQMEIKSNVLTVNIVNEDGDIVKDEEEVPSKLGISEKNQIITEKPESLEKSTVNLEQEVLKNEETSSPVEEPNAEEQDKVNGEENELHSTQSTQELSPVVKGDAIPSNGIPFLSEEIQEKTDSEEVSEIVHQNQISEEYENEKDAIQSNSVATLSDKDSQKELEIPIENASQNPKDVINEVEVPSSTTPLVADEVLEDANGKNDVLEEVQKEQIHQIETPKEKLVEEKECRDETEDQSRDVPLAASSEQTIPKERSQENQTQEMTCEEIEQTEETTGIAKMDETSQIDNEEAIPDEISTSYDQSSTNEETSKRDEGSEQMSEDVKVNDVAESATPLILEASKGSADIKEDAKEISNEDGTEKDASQSTSVIELSESDNQNETVKAIENGSTNPDEVTKELDLKENESPSSVQEILEEAKEKVDVVEVQNEQISEEVKPTEDNIAVGEKDEKMQNENEENDEVLTSSHQDITNEETGKVDEDSKHISNESGLETVTTRDVTPEIEIKDAETKASTSETDNREIEKIEEEGEGKEIYEEVEPSERTDAPLKIEEASLSECKGEKSEADEKLKHQETYDEQEVKSCLETKEKLDESKASPSEEEVCAERDVVETQPLNETERGEEILAQNEIPSESKETNSKDEEVTCEEKSEAASEMLIDGEHDASEGTAEDQLVEEEDQNDEDVKENIEEISEPTETVKGTGVSIGTEIASEEVELESENAVSSQLTKSEEVLPEIPNESTTISEMEEENKRSELLDSEKENMEVESFHEDDPNEKSEAEGSTEVPEAPEEDLQYRTSERSYEQGHMVPEKATEEDGLTIASNDNEIETEKAEIGDASSQGQEENSVIPQKDDESVLEVKPEEETESETLATEQITKTLEVVEEPCMTQNKEELPEAENAIESKETSADSSISTIQQEQQSEDSDAKQTEANQATYDISVEEGMKTNVTLISGIEQIDERSIAKEEEVTAQVENIVVETPDEETEGDSTEKKIEEIPQINAPNEITEVEHCQSEPVAPVTENLAAVSNEKFEDDTNSTDVDAKSDKLEWPLDESIEQKEVLIDTSNAREAQIDQTEFTTEQDQPNQESDVKPSEPDQATDEVSAVEKSEDNATLSASVEQIGVDEGSIANDGKDENSGIPQNDDESELEVKAMEETNAETLTNEEITQKLEDNNDTSSGGVEQIEEERWVANDGKDEDNVIPPNDEDEQELEVKAEEEIKAETVTNEEITQKLEDNATLSGSVAQIEEEGSVANDGKDEDSVIPRNEDESELEVKAEEETKAETLTAEEITQELEEDNATLNESVEQIEEEGSVPNDGTYENSVIPQNDDESELEVKAEEETKAETLTNEETTQKLEEDNATWSGSVEQIEEEGSVANDETDENGVILQNDDELELEVKAEVESKAETLTNEEITQKLEEDNATLSESVEQIGKGEKSVANDGKEEDNVIPQNDDESELEVKAEEETKAQTLTNEEITQKLEEVDEEHCITQHKEELPEADNTIENKETSTDSGISILQRDQQSEESDEKPSDANKATDVISGEEGLEINATLVSSVEQINERSIAKDEGITTQEENSDVETPKEETEGELTEKQIKEIPETTDRSEVTEVELSRSEIVAPETENLEFFSNDKLGDESKSTDIDAKSTNLEGTTDESMEQKDISTEPSNTREEQTEYENITEQDQPNQESDVKPTEVDQARDEASAVVNSEDNTTLSGSVEQIREVEESVANEETVSLQEEDVVVKMPEEEAEKIEATNEKHMEEEIPEVTNPSEVTEVELSQSETVAPETENMEAVSDEKFGDESKATDIDAKSAELESTTDEPTENKEISIEPINTREVQIDQTEITTEQDQLNQVSDMKPTEPELVTDEVSAEENSEVNARLSANIEQTGEAEGLVANEESVILKEENVVAEMPEEEADQNAEATTEKHIEEIPQIVHPSEVTEDQLVESEAAGPEAEHSEIVSDKKFGDGSKFGETDLRSDQMASMIDEIVGEKPNVDLSSSVEQITERSEENEGLLKSTGEQVQGEKTDAIEVAEEPSNKHIDGEFHRTADKELKTILTEKEVNPQIFETQIESPEQEKETEESALVDEKSDTVTLVPGEAQIEEIESANKESVVLPQSTTELPEQKITQGVETNEESSDKDIAREISEIIQSSEISEVQLVESETVRPETEELQIVSNEKLEDESKLEETVVKLAQMVSKSDGLIEENLDANLSSSGEQISEKSEESDVVLQSTDELVQGEKADAEMPKEEASQGIVVAEDPCDKHIEGEILRTADPEICYAVEESKDVLTEKEVDPQNFGTETKSTEQEKTTEELASVEEKSDATASVVPNEGQVKVKSADKESSVVPKSTSESVAIPEERVPIEIDPSEEQSDMDIAREISKIPDLETHDGAIQSEIMLDDEKVDSEEFRTEIESPDVEDATKESALVEKKSDDAANLVHSGGKFEEIEIASEESRVAPQSTIESFTIPEKRVSQGIKANEEPIDKHIVEEQDNTSVDNFEASEEIHLVQEDKVDQAQTTASPIEQHDSKNDGTEMESAFLENTNGDLDVKEDLDATSVPSIVEEEGAAINKTDNGPESVPTVKKTKQIDVKILSDVPPETSNSTETEKPHVKEDAFDTVITEPEEDALDTVVTEPEDPTKDEDLIRTESQEEISGQEKNIAIITFEAVSEEYNTDSNQKGGDQHTENTAGQEAIEQTEREIDVTELLKAAEQKVAVDEMNEDPRETVPNFSKQSKEVEEEAKQSEGPEQDFASIVSSFLISKVLSDENQKADDGMKQNNDASSIPKPSDDETIQEITTTKTEPETEHEEILYATSSREVKSQIQEPEEENREKTVEENEEEDGVEQDYLPVSRFLMDKILRQEENKNLQEEKSIEVTDKHLVNDGGIQVEEKIEETDKHLVNDGGIKVEEKIEENSHIVLVPEQKGEPTSSFAELPRDFEKGETQIRKVENTFAGDGAIFIEEKVEEHTVVAELTKLEGEGSHSPIEVASNFLKEEKPAEAPKPIEDENESLVSDVGISNVEYDEGENSSDVVVAEQEGESFSPIEAIRDFEKGNKSIELKNEVLVTDEGIPIIQNIEENAGEVAISKLGEKNLYPGEVARDFDKDKKPAEEKDETMVSVDEVEAGEEGGNSKVTLVEEVEDFTYREHSKDLVEEALVNVQEISNPEKVIEENRNVGMHREEEHEKEVIIDKETPKDVRNVEENYVFVEHEASQFEEPKEILKEEKVADDASDATISNLEEKQTNLSTGIHDDKTNLAGQVEITEKGVNNSSVSCQDIEQSLSNIPKVPMATEIVKELVGNETKSIHGEEHVKEVTDTVVESIENRNQEKLTETEATKIEKKSEEIKNEEHEEEEEEEEEEERHQGRETEIIGRDLTVKAEAKETEMKLAQKKSHNILSGVGSKVKHSFAKVKKVITGKSKNVSPTTK